MSVPLGPKSSDIHITVTEEELTLSLLKERSSTINNLAYFDKPWFTYGYLQKLTWHIFIITLSSTNYGYDGSMLNGLQVFDIWNKKMSNPTGSVLGALSNGTVFGNILSFFIAGYIADSFGRKTCIAIVSSIIVLGTLLQCDSTNYGFFLSTRLIIGFGTGFSSVASPTLIAEISVPDMNEEVAT